MNAEAIFQPMLGVMALTAVVWVYLYAVRIPAMRRAKKRPQTYTVPEAVAETLPEKANYPANNFKNLFELPVLFYVLCFYLFATNSVDALYVYSAWAFFGFRAAHSLVHCTYNRVMHRFVLYCLGAAALFFMLVRAIVNAL